VPVGDADDDLDHDFDWDFDEWGDFDEQFDVGGAEAVVAGAGSAP
jgi:hypothetical protein